MSNELPLAAGTDRESPPRWTEVGPNAHMPQPAFRFIVQIDGRNIGAFLDCKLPPLKWKTQEIKEGGLNTHPHELFGPRKKTKLMLQRGVGITGDLLDWYAAALSGRMIRKTVAIILLDNQGNQVVTWTIEGAFPIDWKGPKLETKSKAIAIETLSLSCGRITVTKGDQYQ